MFMSAWDEFKAGWREAGETHRRILSWTVLSTLLIMAGLYLLGWIK